jgi:hypothetical protein
MVQSGGRRTNEDKAGSWPNEYSEAYSQARCEGKFLLRQGSGWWELCPREHKNGKSSDSVQKAVQREPAVMETGDEDPAAEDCTLSLQRA